MTPGTIQLNATLCSDLFRPPAIIIIPSTRCKCKRGKMRDSKGDFCSRGELAYSTFRLLGSAEAGQVIGCVSVEVLMVDGLDFFSGLLQVLHGTPSSTHKITYRMQNLPPTKGQNNSFLLHAILAVAALHLFTLNPTHPLAVQYSCAAVSHYNQAVSSIPDSDLRGADDGTVFTAQLLIGIYGFATSLSVPVSSDWLRILRRTAPTFRNPLASLQYTVVAALIPWVTGPHDEDAGLPLTAFTQSLTTLPLPINGVPEIHEVRDAAVSATYQHAIRFLQKSLAASPYPDFHLHAAFPLV
ncbi:hypothetical protein BDZ89DRAFT_1145925 [Hymenopellis radicata]|nr:hypothetical protein BDZ89DRAFT_1145925 [Hymenopellis radicata]